MGRPGVTMTIDSAALGASLVAIERMLDECKGITREGMEEHFAGSRGLVGGNWLDALSHLMSAQDHIRIAGAFLCVDGMPPQRGVPVNVPTEGEAVIPVEPAHKGTRSRRPAAPRRRQR